MSGGRPRTVPIPSTRASAAPSPSRSTSSTREIFEKLTKRFSYRGSRRSGAEPLFCDALTRSGGIGVGMGVGTGVGAFCGVAANPEATAMAIAPNRKRARWF